MQVIPAIDVLSGRIVRLKQGDFSRASDYGDDPVALAQKYAAQGASALHLVNLTGTKDGCLGEDFLRIVRSIGQRTNLAVQTGGGIRSIADIAALIEAGADRIVLGTAVFTDPDLVRSAILLFGPSRIIAALDCRNGEVRIRGWQEGAGVTLEEALEKVRKLGLTEILVTDIGLDGMEEGPNVALYESIRRQFPALRITASGGVRNAADVRRLSASGCTAVVVGKTLLGRRTNLADLRRATCDLALRVIPCLDIANGRTVKGTRFQNLRDAGDPVELARRYCAEGADELVFLDITATEEKRGTVIDLVSRVADTVNIPFSIGGGVRSAQDAKRLLEAGADKVSVNSAAILRPALLNEMSEQLGKANTICAIDAKRRSCHPELACTEPGRSTEGWIVLIKGGKEETERDALEWAREATSRGAGELLVTSWDRDGTKQGFDTELLRAMKEVVTVPVIASGGAGSLQDFIDAVADGRADAVLAASVFHSGTFSIADVKRALREASIPVRLTNAYV